MTALTAHEERWLAREMVRRHLVALLWWALGMPYELALEKQELDP